MLERKDFFVHFQGIKGETGPQGAAGEKGEQVREADMQLTCLKPQQLEINKIHH